MEAIEDCPECGKALQVPPGDVGRRVACPRCSHQFIAKGSRSASPTREEPRKEQDREERPRRERRDEDDGNGSRERGRPPAGKKYCTRCGAVMPRREKYCPDCDARQPEDRDPELAEANSKKVTAGVLAILLGGIGVHKFVLGLTTAGVIMLLVSLLTCGIGWGVMHIIGIVEGIIYLTKSDEDFHRIYLVEKKEWF
jgi:TM2 domain-containing membrane protein YozV